ncbi:VrtR2 [Penicillium malachiteum]|uniref:VrtR2 n=1 Tax=Penicillium malachiteum TaxID=1324776 RepID=UPI0025491EC1|nr:VrtR2 [Penicillium malachiteum]KAJ5714340.1 VrtR2 [Penicillium malachiteum]
MDNSSASMADGRGLVIQQNEHQQVDPAIPQLSCASCRDRKLKCDKLDPCTNCTASGLVCISIYRPRLRRGRHARRSGQQSSPPPAINREQVYARSAAEDTAVNKNLTERVCRLESLVQTVGSVTTSADMRHRELSEPGVNSDVWPVTSAPLSPTLSRSTKKRGLSNSNSLWVDLVQEMKWTAKAISPPMQADLAADSGISALGLFDTVDPFAPRQVQILCEDRGAVRQLCQIYLQNVDPIIKILHRPSLGKWMIQGERYLDYPEEHPAVNALASAVFYSAANSMTENQCQSIFHTSKSSFVMAYRGRCEVAVEKSGLLTTRDITTLKAFILYLTSRSSEDKSVAIWTLVALAVRIAKALNLHQDQGENFFEQQMRKRLWLTICLIDLQASFAQSSEPLITDREGLTDTTFALITYHVQVAGRLLNFPDVEPTFCNSNGSHGGSSSSSVTSVSSVTIMNDQKARKQHVRRFKQEALELLGFCGPESSPYAWFTWHGTQCLLAAVRLSELRPLSRSVMGNQAPPLPSGVEAGDTELLRQALHNLEKAQLICNDPRGEGFRWYITIPRAALVASVAECYLCTDKVLLRRAWPVIEASYRHHEAVLRQSGEAVQGSLPQMMRQTREKLAPLLHGDHPINGIQSLGMAGNGSSNSSTTQSLHPTEAPLRRPNTAPPSKETAIDATGSDMTFEAGFAAATSTQLPPRQTWDSTSFLTKGQPMLTAPPLPTTTAGWCHPLSSSDVLGPSWTMGQEEEDMGCF